MKKAKIIIPIVFLLIAILIMNSSKLLRLTKHESKIPTLLDQIETFVNEENYLEALEKVDELITIFNNISKFIQFSVELDNLKNFDIELKSLKGYIVSKDKTNSISKLYVLKEYWQSFI